MSKKPNVLSFAFNKHPGKRAAAARPCHDYDEAAACDITKPETFRICARCGEGPWPYCINCQECFYCHNDWAVGNEDRLRAIEEYEREHARRCPGDLCDPESLPYESEGEEW